MSKAEPGEWGDEVVAFAESRGFRVTTEMRTDYHRAGALPRPRVVGLGRGRGVRALYPTGTSLQLVRLCQLVKQTHSVQLADAILWLEGYRVSPAAFRSLTSSVFGALDVMGQQFRDAMNANGATPGAEPAMYRAVDWLDSSKRLKGTSLGKLRKVVGIEDFRTLFAMTFERMSEPEGPLVIGDLDALARLYGMEGASATDLRILEDATRPPSPAALQAQLASLTDEELCRYRDEIATVLQFLFGAFEVQRLLETGDGIPNPAIETGNGSASQAQGAQLTSGYKVGLGLVFILKWAELKATETGRISCDALLGHFNTAQPSLALSFKGEAVRALLTT